MAELIAPLPRLTLSPGMTIRLEAIDPDTGAPVTGVVVSNLAIYGTVGGAAAETDALVEVNLPEVEPLWAPTPAEFA